jgi:hypothetical protein
MLNKLYVTLMDLHVSMIINRKKKHRNSGKLIKEVIDIIERYKVQVGLDNSFEKELDIFVLSYLKLLKLVDIKRDSIENIEISKNIIDEIITKVENNDFIVPGLNKKKIIIEEGCRKHYDKKTDIKIEMV